MLKKKTTELQYKIDREASKLSALPSGEIDKYDYVTGQEILPSNRIQIYIFHSGKRLAKSNRETRWYSNAFASL